jgi:signal transduction histidine kinase
MIIRINHLVHSFRFRLTLLFVAILAVILVGFSVFIYTRQVQVLRAEAVTRLSGGSVQLASYYEALLRRTLEEPNEAPLFNLSQDKLPLLGQDDLFAVIGLDGTVIQEQGRFQNQELTSLINHWQSIPAAEGPMTIMRTSSDERDKQIRSAYLYEITLIHFETRWSGAILLGTPLDPGNQLERLAITLAITNTILLLLAFVGGYWLADRAMQPVQTITHTVRQIGEGDLSRRLHLDRQDEIGELAETFDQMLARLQAAFERQRQFTADASHELRTPLAIIELESNRALERSRSTEEYEKTLRVIQSENERMSELINELLLLARIDGGQAVMRNELIDLSDIAVEVLERLNDLAEERSVRLTTGSMEEAAIQADRSYLTQLVTNLVENAIKYTRGDQAQVLVETGKATQGGTDWVWIQVADNGPGISPEHLLHLFDRFYRIDPSRKRDEQESETEISGSGLGLSIADSIAKAYRGRIDVKSEPGQGTTFTVWLMVADR